MHVSAARQPRRCLFSARSPWACARGVRWGAGGRLGWTVRWGEERRSGAGGELAGAAAAAGSRPAGPHLEGVAVQEAHLALYPLLQALVHLLRCDVRLAGAARAHRGGGRGRELGAPSRQGGTDTRQLQGGVRVGARPRRRRLHLLGVRQGQVPAPHVAVHGHVLGVGHDPREHAAQRAVDGGEHLGERRRGRGTGNDGEGVRGAATARKPAQGPPAAGRPPAPAPPTPPAPPRGAAPQCTTGCPRAPTG
jgi:hypothetical protein